MTSHSPIPKAYDFAPYGGMVLVDNSCFLPFSILQWTRTRPSKNEIDALHDVTIQTDAKTQLDHEFGLKNTWPNDTVDKVRAACGWP